MSDLIERLEAIRDNLSEWDHPITGKDDINAAIARIRELEAIVEKHCKRTKDGAWVHPGDQVWIATTRGPRWFRLQPDWSIPVCFPLEGGQWHDMGVEDCYATPEAAEKARGG